MTDRARRVVTDRQTPPFDLRGLAHGMARESARTVPPESPTLKNGDLLLTSVPLVALTVEELRTLPLDGCSGFILSLIDGRTNVEDILDLCALDRAEVIERVLALLRQGAIVLRES